MRAPCTAGFGANAESFIHDLADGAGTTAALGAATEAAIDLPCRPGRLLCVGDDTANVVVAQHIAGTDDHQHQLGGKRGPDGYVILSDRMQKQNGQFQAIPNWPFSAPACSAAPAVPVKSGLFRSTIVAECYGKIAPLKKREIITIIYVIPSVNALAIS
jgi:hypothetical protein